MTAIDRILVAVDFDSASAAALVYARDLAVRLGAELTILHADGTGGRPGGTEAAQDALQVFIRQVDSDVTSGQSRVVAGDAVSAIVTESLARDVGLLALGSHGRGRIGRMALGSVVSGVLHAAGTAVLIVKGVAEPFANGPVCAGIDFKASSEAVLGVAATLAQRADATLALVHVLPLGDHHSAGHEVLRRDAFDRLEALRRRLVPAGVQSESFVEMVRMSDPAGTIVAHAAELGARLIVVGRHGGTSIAEHALGSVAERVLQRADVPVLVGKPA